jgi:hypothetical protein
VFAVVWLGLTVRFLVPFGSLWVCAQWCLQQFNRYVLRVKSQAESSLVYNLIRAHCVFVLILGFVHTHHFRLKHRLRLD